MFVCLFVFQSFNNYTNMDGIDVSLLQEKVILPKLLDSGFCMWRLVIDKIRNDLENLLGIFFI